MKGPFKKGPYSSFSFSCCGTEYLLSCVNTETYLKTKLSEESSSHRILMGVTNRFNSSRCLIFHLPIGLRGIRTVSSLVPRGTLMMEGM